MNQFGARRMRALVLGLIGLATACGGGDSVSTSAKAPATAAEQPGALGFAEDCRQEEAEDEYGFLVTIEVCGGASSTESPGGDTVPQRAADTAAYVGSAPAEVLATALRDRLVLQNGCTNATPPALGERLDATAIRNAIETLPTTTLQEQLVSLLSAISAADEVCDDATAWTSGSWEVAGALDQFLVELSSADNTVLTGLTAPSGAPDDAANAMASILASLNDQAFHVLTARTNGIDSSELWFSAVHLGHVRGIRQLAATGTSPDLVTVGSSVVALDIDPLLLQSQLGQTVVNAGLVGASLEEQIVWATGDLLTEATPSTIVWGVTSRPFNYCSTDTLEQALAVPERAAVGFAAVAGVGERNPRQRLLGPPEGSTYPGNRLTAAFDALYPGWQQGTYTTKEGFDQDAAAAQTGGYGIDPTGPCEAEYADFEAALGRLTSAGIDVIVVAMPTSDPFRNLIADGDQIDREAIDRLAGVAGAGRAAFIDLSRAEPDSAYIDLVHLGAGGRASFTNTLAQSLAPLVGS